MKKIVSNFAHYKFWIELGSKCNQSLEGKPKALSRGQKSRNGFANRPDILRNHMPLTKLEVFHHFLWNSGRHWKNKLQVEHNFQMIDLSSHENHQLQNPKSKDRASSKSQWVPGHLKVPKIDPTSKFCVLLHFYTTIFKSQWMPGHPRHPCLRGPCPNLCLKSLFKKFLENL